MINFCGGSFLCTRNKIQIYGISISNIVTHHSDIINMKYIGFGVMECVLIEKIRKHFEMSGRGPEHKKSNEIGGAKDGR